MNESRDARIAKIGESMGLSENLIVTGSTPEPFPEWLTRQISAARRQFDTATSLKVRRRSWHSMLLLQGIQSEYERRIEADHEALTRQIEALTAERDKAVERAKRAWAAATDETLIGWHRDMALRFSEDRDIQKHRARNAEARAEQAEHRATALEAKIKYLADGWCIPSTAYYVGTGSIEHLAAWQSALKWCATELSALLTGPRISPDEQD